jgi:hypothetical protein
MIMIVAKPWNHRATVEVNKARRCPGKRANALIVANRNEPIVLYRKCLVRCEMSINGNNLAIEKITSGTIAKLRCPYATTQANTPKATTVTSLKRIRGSLVRIGLLIS